jgi:hypothetical protein
MPRSPWLASAGWTKKAGVPVLDSVEAILRRDVPGLADAAHDHATAAAEDQLHRLDEARVERCDQIGNRPRLDFEHLARLGDRDHSVTRPAAGCPFALRAA